MPLYEGVGLIHENAPIVLDIGSVYTKLGFAGETGPSCFRIIPSEVDCSRTKKKRKIDSYTSEADLYSLLADLIHYIHFKQLLVNPKERRIVIIESLLANSLFRKTLAKVLLGQFEVQSVLFLPSHIAAVFTLGISTGLILDVGYYEATVLPVYECFPVLGAWQALPLGSDTIHKTLKNRLLKEAKIWKEVQLEEVIRPTDDDITEKLLEDIKVRCCFVTSAERSKKMKTTEAPAPPQGTLYPLGGDKTLYIPGEIREEATEILFELDIDDKSIATMVLDAICKAPIDMRKQLAENIVVIGGTAMLAGFKQRLLAEIRHLANTAHYANKLSVKMFKMHKLPARENYAAWLGGAILGATDLVVTKSLTREKYSKDKIIPEWCDLRTNDPTNETNASLSSRHIL